MSFLKGGAAGALGSLTGADPSRISSIANSIGTAANGIAAAGGAAPGYAAPQQPNNYMQYADPNSLQAILSKFGNTNMPVSVTNQMPPPRYAGMGIPEYAR